MKHLPYLILFFLLTITISVIGQNTIWPETFEGYAFQDIEKTYDNGFAFSGFKTNDLDVYFLGYGVLRKVDINGDILWEKLIGLNPPPAYTDLKYVNQTNDGGYIVSGYFWGRDFDGGDNLEMYEEGLGKLRVKPNPAKNYFIVEYELPDKTSHAILNIQSLNGINCFSSKVNGKKNEIAINSEKMTSGIYIVTLESGFNVLLSCKVNIVK